LDAVEEAGGGAAREERDEDDPATVSFDGPAFVLVDGFEGVIAALHIDVGLGGIEEADGADFGKDGDGVDAAEGGEDTGAVVFWYHRSGGTLELTDGVVAVESDEEGVAVAAGGFEIGNMAGMEEIEAAVGDDEALSALAEGVAPDLELIRIEDLGSRRHAGGRIGNGSDQVTLASRGCRVEAGEMESPDVDCHGRLAM
jgi:hypothetical protein